MKKFLAILLGSLLLMAALLFGFYKLKDQGVIQTNYTELIPASAIAVLDFQDPQTFYAGLDSNLQSSSLKRLELFKNLVPTAFSDTSSLFQLMDSVPWQASVHVVGSDKIGLIYFVEKSNIPYFELKHIAGNSKYKSHVFKDVTIHELKNATDNQRSIAFLDRGNVLVVSEYMYLLEEIIVGFKEGNILSADSDFMQIENMSSKSKINTFYINPQNWTLIKSLFTKAEGGVFLETLPKWTTWLSLQPTIMKDHISLSGYASNACSNCDYSNTIKGPPINSQLINYIPNNAASFTLLLSEDIKASSRLNSPNAMERFNQSIKPWLGNELALVRMEYYGSDPSKAMMLILSCDNPDDVLESLATYYTTLEDNIYQINTTLDALIPIDACQGMASPYFIVKDDVVYFSNTLALIKQMKNLDPSTEGMKGNEGYLATEQNLPSASHLTFYFHPQLARGYLSLNANNAFQQVLTDQKDMLTHSGPLLMKWTAAGNAYIVDGIIDFSKNQASLSSNSVWSLPLGAKATSCIYPVQNHYTKDWELLVQDEQHTVYLIDKSGQILWNRTLEAPIISAVHVMDFFKNNKYQYVFNTPFKIHLIDRKGRNTANYPIDLHTETNCGIALFDYDGNKNYRIFANSGNGNLYAYEKNGKPLNGWNPKFNVGELVSPVIHSRYDGKDNIYMLNTDGEFKSFNRRGEERFADIQIDDVSNNVLQLVETKEGVTLYASTVGGNMHSILHNGEMTISEHALSKDHQFIAIDFDADGNTEFGVLDGNEFKIYDQSWTVLAQHNMQSLQSSIKLVEGNQEKWISIHDPNNSETILLTLRGEALIKHQFEAYTHVNLVNLFKDDTQVAVYGNSDGDLTCKRLAQ